MSESQNDDSALLPCQISKWILTMTMTGEENPKSLRGSKRRHPNQMVGDIQFLEMMQWQWDNDLNLRVLLTNATDPFDLSYVRPWQLILWQFFSVFFQGFCGFGSERKSLVNLRVFLGKTEKSRNGRTDASVSKHARFKNTSTPNG